MIRKVQQTTEGKLYTAFCEEFDLKPEWLGKTFKYTNGRTYTITGLNLRSKKFPVVTKDGTRFKADYIRALMTGSLEALEKQRKQEHEKKVRQELRKARDTYLHFGEDTYGLKKQWLDKSFSHHGHTYTIIGLEFGRSRTKIIVRRADRPADDNRVEWFSSPEFIIEKMAGKKKKAA